MILSDLCEICNRDGTHLLIISRGFRKDMMVKARTCDQHKQEVKLMLSKQLAILCD